MASGGVNPSGRASVGEWTNGRDLRPLQRALNADFTLVLFVRDVQRSGAKKYWDNRPDQIAFKAIHKEDIDLKRILTACAMELASGRIVWCSSIVDRWTEQDIDITVPAESSRLVKELLTEF